MFSKISNREGLPELQLWQMNYLMNIIDDDKDGRLDVDEFLSNYRIIVKVFYFIFICIHEYSEL